MIIIIIVLVLAIGMERVLESSSACGGSGGCDTCISTEIKLAM